MGYIHGISVSRLRVIPQVWDNRRPIRGAHHFGKSMPEITDPRDRPRSSRESMRKRLSKNTIEYHYSSFKKKHVESMSVGFMFFIAFRSLCGLPLVGNEKLHQTAWKHRHNFPRSFQAVWCKYSLSHWFLNQPSESFVNLLSLFKPGQIGFENTSSNGHLKKQPRTKAIQSTWGWETQVMDCDTYDG